MSAQGRTSSGLDPHGQFAAALLLSARTAHASGAALRLLASHPEQSGSFGAAGFPDVKAHAEGLVDHVAQALAVDCPALYQAHVSWLKQGFAARKADLGALEGLLRALRDELAEALPPEAARAAAAVAGAGLAHFDVARPEAPGPLEDGGEHVELARRYLLCVLEGRRLDAIRLAEDAIAGGMSVTDLYTQVLGRAQVEIGRMWQRGEIHVAEEHLSSRITEQVLSIVNTRMPRKARNGKRVLVTTASGDLHDIGLRMVADHFEMAGWDVVFLGASTPPGDVARAVRDFDVDLVAVAAKLVLHVRSTVELIQAVRGATPGRRLPILVGGTPFQIAPDLWRTVGADGVASSAVEAVAVGERLTARAG